MGKRILNFEISRNKGSIWEDLWLGKNLMEIWKNIQWFITSCIKDFLYILETPISVRGQQDRLDVDVGLSVAAAVFVLMGVGDV
ncbi:hypothetical protein ACJX0J_009267, partial [Zea mays]